MNQAAHRIASWLHPKQGFGRYLLETAVFVPCYLALDWVSYIEPVGSFNITPWNPGPGLAVAWMIHAGLAKAPVVFAATFLADDVIRGISADHIALLSALTLSGGYALIAATLRALFPRERVLETIRALTALVGSVVVGTALNGAVFLGVLAGTGLLNADLFVSSWLRFCIGDVVGILVTAPLLLMLADTGGRSRLASLRGRAESYLQIGLLAFIIWFILAGLLPDPSHGLFVLFPPLIWIALRSGLAGALIAVTIVQLGIGIAFHQQVPPVLPIIELQVLVATLTLTGLYLGVMVDEREQTLERLNQSLHLAAAGEMAGAITHEVSQPLTALTNYSRSAKHLIAKGRGDAELGSLVDKIFTESVRASRVVRRLREFFRAGAMRLQPVASAELLEMIDRVGGEATAGTSLTFTKDSDPDLPAVRMDILQIELVLRNLIGNAVDSLEEHSSGRGKIAVSVKRDRARTLCIAVADNGPGIPAAAKAQLFRPFASGKPNGMGLGLAVSRAIAEAHGGSLDVGPAAQGEFRLVLPLDLANG